MKVFINFVKRFLIGEIKRRMGISKDVEVLLLLVSDFLARS